VVTAALATIAALGLLAIHVHVHPLPGVAALERLTVDARFRARGPRPPATDRIVIVGLDDRTRTEAYDIFISRAAWARFLTKLAAYQPKIVALDLFYDAPETLLPADLATRVRDLDAAQTAHGSGSATADPAQLVVRDVAEALRGDQHLADAIAASHNIYLGASFIAGEPSTTPPPPTLAAAALGQVGDSGAGGTRRPMVAAAVDASLPEIARGATGAGAVNVFHDPDGATRTMPLVVGYAGHYYASLGLQVALADLGAPHDTAYVVGAPELTAAGRALPLGDEASGALDFLGPHAFPTVSAADIIAGRVDRAQLAGKLVFVGFTYADNDKVATPLARIADGVEMHATLAENVLADRLFTRAGPGATALATLALCALVVLAQLRRIRQRAWVPLLVALAALGVYVALAQILFARGTILELGAPIALVVLVLAAATISELATEGREKAHLRATFSQYVSGDVVDQLVANPALARLGGERRQLTVLFSDIRGFSKLAENMEPEQLAALLGEYLTPMTDLVLASGGTLDKYIGDAVMAMWSAPVTYGDHAARACEVALRMQEELAKLNGKWTAAGKPTLAIGVGLNTGAMVVGNMGSAARFDYTVIGDEVNLASRLEGLTKEYGAKVLVGEATARAAGDGFVLRELDVVRVSGRATAAPVFELVGRRGATHAAAYGDALALYRARDFAAAREKFAAIADDKPAAVMAARCAVLVEAPPAADWDGVYDQHGK
jgi:adenylate cyclase